MPMCFALGGGAHSCRRVRARYTCSYTRCGTSSRSWKLRGSCPPWSTSATCSSSRSRSFCWLEAVVSSPASGEHGVIICCCWCWHRCCCHGGGQYFFASKVFFGCDGLCKKYKSWFIWPYCTSHMYQVLVFGDNRQMLRGLLRVVHKIHRREHRLWHIPGTACFLRDACSLLIDASRLACHRRGKRVAIAIEFVFARGRTLYLQNRLMLVALGLFKHLVT